MIVCSCNVITDRAIRDAVSAAQMPPRTPGQVYGCLGCSAQCGRCARTVRKIMDETLAACAKSCCSGCPHSEAHGHKAAPVAPADDVVRRIRVQGQRQAVRRHAAMTVPALI